MLCFLDCCVCLVVSGTIGDPAYREKYFIGGGAAGSYVLTEGVTIASTGPSSTYDVVQLNLAIAPSYACSSNSLTPGATNVKVGLYIYKPAPTPAAERC